MVNVEGPGYHIREHRSIRAGVEFVFRGFAPASNVQSGSDELPVYGEDLIEVSLVLPPLNLDAMQIVQAKIAAIGAENIAGQMVILANCCAYALARNYAGVPKWLITQSIDAANYTDMLDALMDISGAKHRRDLEEKKRMAASQAPASPQASAA